MRRGRTIGILVVALAASACGVGGSLTYPAAVEGARPGGALRIGIVQPVSIDPGLAADADSQLVVSTMCDPIVQIDPDTGEATAGMAEHVVLDDTGGAVTITLKDGLRFSDGKEVTVADVRASLSRIASDSVASPLAEELRPIAGWALVHGDISTKEAGLSEDDPSRTLLQGIIQVTNKVFTVGGVQDPELVLRLARPWSAIMPRRLALDPKTGRRPVCVGPYRMTADWTAGDPEIRLERNPFYKGTDESHTNGGKGYPDQVTFRAYPDRAAVHQAFLRGDVDVARLDREQLGAPLPGGRISTAPTSAVEYIGMPTNIGVYRDARVRTALSKAIDRSALLQQVGRPDRLPAVGFLPMTMPGALVSRPACTAAATHDVAAAQQLMVEAEVDLKGQEVPIYFNDDPGSGNKELMAAVGTQWQAAFGLVPKLVPMPWEQYRERGIGNLGFDHPFRASWRTVTPAPSSFLRSQLGGSAVGTTNLSRWSDGRFEAAYIRGLEREIDPETRLELLGRLLDRVCEASPLAPMWVGTESFAVRDTVAAADGRLQSPTTGELNVRELYVLQP